MDDGFHFLAIFNGEVVDEKLSEKARRLLVFTEGLVAEPEVVDELWERQEAVGQGKVTRGGFELSGSVELDAAFEELLGLVHVGRLWHLPLILAKEIEGLADSPGPKMGETDVVDYLAVR